MCVTVVVPTNKSRNIPHNFKMTHRHCVINNSTSYSTVQACFDRVKWPRYVGDYCQG